MMHQAVGPVERLEIHPTGADVRRASVWLTARARAMGLSDDAIYRLEMCLNEALANVIEHGGEQALVDIVRLIFSVADEHGTLKATLTISDAGLAFSPLSALPGEQVGKLADSQPGGLGLAILRRLADKLTYTRALDRNELTLQVNS